MYALRGAVRPQRRGTPSGAVDVRAPEQALWESLALVAPPQCSRGLLTRRGPVEDSCCALTLVGLYGALCTQPCWHLRYMLRWGCQAQGHPCRGKNVGQAVMACCKGPRRLRWEPSWAGLGSVPVCSVPGPGGSSRLQSSHPALTGTGTACQPPTRPSHSPTRPLCVRAWGRRDGRRTQSWVTGAAQSEQPACAEGALLVAQTGWAWPRPHVRPSYVAWQMAQPVQRLAHRSNGWWLWRIRALLRGLRGAGTRRV